MLSALCPLPDAISLPPIPHPISISFSFGLFPSLPASSVSVLSFPSSFAIPAHTPPSWIWIHWYLPPDGCNYSLYGSYAWRNPLCFALSRFLSTGWTMSPCCTGIRNAHYSVLSVLNSVETSLSALYGSSVSFSLYLDSGSSQVATHIYVHDNLYLIVNSLLFLENSA